MTLRLLLVTAISLVFGVADAVAWQHVDGTWFWAANASSAYLVLAFAAGALSARARPGLWLLVGAGSVLLALFSFYAWRMQIGHLAPSQAHEQFTRYAVPGLPGGAAFGYLGGWWATRRAGWALLPVALALTGEPLAWREHLGFLPRAPLVWSVEVGAGVTLMLVAAAQLATHVRQQRST